MLLPPSVFTDWPLFAPMAMLPPSDTNDRFGITPDGISGWLEPTASMLLVGVGSMDWPL